jgi:SAM-dependent methyltransferase
MATQPIIKRIRRIYSSRGLAGILSALLRRLRHEKARCSPVCARVCQGRSGLEIGGPSQMFTTGGLLPVYPLFQSLDNCNFAKKTVWEGSVREGMTFVYESSREPGRQFVAEATNLVGIAPESYDVLLSSHVLEHLANPLSALCEWKRILRQDGWMILVIPHKEGTFDHRRPVTSLQHLESDSTTGTGEDDTTHLPEVLELHDLAMDPDVGTFDEFQKRCLQNYLTRCLHHHVFDTALVVQILHSAGLQLHAIEAILPFHIVAVAQKLPHGAGPDNLAFLSEDAEYRRLSPFLGDSGRIM